MKGLSYTNVDLKMSPFVSVHIKIIPWIKFTMLILGTFKLLPCKVCIFGRKCATF